jgi:hypothetical protein
MFSSRRPEENIPESTITLQLLSIENIKNYSPSTHTQTVSQSHTEQTVPLTHIQTVTPQARSLESPFSGHLKRQKRTERRAGGRTHATSVHQPQNVYVREKNGSHTTVVEQNTRQVFKAARRALILFLLFCFHSSQSHHPHTRIPQRQIYRHIAARRQALPPYQHQQSDSRSELLDLVQGPEDIRLDVAVVLHVALQVAFERRILKPVFSLDRL